MPFSQLGRLFVLVLSCCWLAACTQTTGTGNSAVSTYSGLISDQTVDKSEAERRAKKRQAARARAAKQREARKRAFEKKRAERIAQRKTASKKATSAKTGHKTRDEARKKTAAKRARKVTRKHAAKTTRKVAKAVAKKPVKKTSRKKAAKPAAIKASYAASAGARVATAGKPWGCVPGRLKAVLGQVARKYGRVTVNSTHRSRGNNRKAGGKKRSYHLKCQAVDFRVHGNTKGLTRFLASHKLVGGYKRYKSGFYHIDTGPKRTW